MSLVGCYYQENLPKDAVLCLGTSQGQPRHVFIRYLVEGVGSAHYPGLTRWTREQLDALDVRSESSTVDADSLKLYLYDGKIKAEKISGHISIQEGFIDIQLKFLIHPRIGVTEWKDYPRNGKFPLRIGSCSDPGS